MHLQNAAKCDKIVEHSFHQTNWEGLKFCRNKSKHKYKVRNN